MYHVPVLLNETLEGLNIKPNGVYVDVTFGGGGHGVSRRSATNGADYYLPGYFVADAFAAYKMKLQYPVTLQLNVKNLFDKTYYTSSIATNNLGNQIGDPREVQFTVKMEF